MTAPGPRALRLDRRLGAVEYFTLGFGTMVGAGWLVILDDFLRRGGPVGGALGFLLGALALLPIGLTYARLVAALPDAGGEVAYTERVFPPSVSFVTGWFVVLAYLVVCPWEAVAVGKLLARVIPGLDAVKLYEVGGQPVFLLRLLAGLLMTAAIGFLNFRGIRFSAAFQNVCTFGLLAVFALFTVLGLFKGDSANLQPLFARPGAQGGTFSAADWRPAIIAGRTLPESPAGHHALVLRTFARRGEDHAAPRLLLQELHDRAAKLGFAQADHFVFPWHGRSKRLDPTKPMTSPDKCSIPAGP